MDVQQQDGPQFAVSSPRFASMPSPRLGQSYLSPTQDVRQLDPQHRLDLELHSSMDPARAAINHTISPRAGYDFWHSNHTSPALAPHSYSSHYAPSSHASSATQQPTHLARRSPSPLAPLLPASAPTPVDSHINPSARERSVPIHNSGAGAINSPPSTLQQHPSQLQHQHPQQPHRLPPQQPPQQPQQQFPLSFPNTGAANSITQHQLALYQQQLQLNQQQQQQLAHEHQLKLEQVHQALMAAGSDGGQKRKANASAASVLSSPTALNEQQQSQMKRQRSGNNAPASVPAAAAAAALSPNVALQHPPPPSFLSMDVDPLVLQRQLHEQMLFQEKLLQQQQSLLALKRQQEQIQQHLSGQSPIVAALAHAQPFVAAAAAGADPRSPQTWQQQQPQSYQHPPHPLPSTALPASALPTNAIVIPPLVRRSSSLFDHSPSPVAAVVPAVAVGGASKYTPSPPPPPSLGALLASSHSPRASPGVSAGGMGHIGNLQGLASTPKESKVVEIICGTVPPTDVTSPPAVMMDMSSAPNSGGTGGGVVSPTRSNPRDDDLQTASSRRARIASMTKGAPARFSRIGRAIVKTDVSTPDPPSSTHTQARSVGKRESRPATKRARKKQASTDSEQDDENSESKAASDNTDEDANSDDSNESESEGEQEDDDDDETSEADEKPRRKAKSARKSSPASRTPARKPTVAGKKKDSGSSPQPSPSPAVKLNANGKPKREKGSSCHQCKTRRIDAVDLHYCGMTHPRRPAPPGARQRKRKKERVCRKKYCTRCLEKFYGEEAPPKPAPGEPNTFVCPGCRGLCTCAACKRGFSKKEEQEAAQPAAGASAASVKNGEHKSPAASSAAPTPASQRSRPSLTVQAKVLPVDHSRPLVASPVTPHSSAVATVVKKHSPADRGAHAKRMHQAAIVAVGRKRAEPHGVQSSSTAAESEGPTRRSPRNVVRRMSIADRARDLSDPDRDDDSQNALSETSLPVDALDGLQSTSPVVAAHRSVLGLTSPLRSVRRGARRDSNAALSHVRSDTPDGEMLSLSPAKHYSSLRSLLSPRHGLTSSHGLPDLGSHGFASMGMSPAETGVYRSLGGHDGDEGGSASAPTSTYTGPMSGENSPMMHSHVMASRRSSRASLMSGGGIGSNSSMMRSRRIGGTHGDADGVMAEAAGIKRADPLPELL